MIITLPVPDERLWPNARCHWRAKAEAVRKMRYWSMLAAMDAKPGGHIPLLQATVKCRFYFRTKRRRDPDNAAAACKSIWDGFTDAKIWVDDCGLKHLPPTFGVDAKSPRVEIEVTET